MKIYYVQMNSPGGLVPATLLEGLRLRKVDPPDGRVNQRFYRAVGGPWKWTDRAPWPAETWNDYVSEYQVVTTVLEKREEEIGYAEIMNREGEVEIVNFGLLEPFIGRGFGSAALAEVVQFAWKLPGARRLWLHTCDNDHPNALNSYQRRGFEVYRIERK